jgi:hypothetical protein
LHPEYAKSQLSMDVEVNPSVVAFKHSAMSCAMMMTFHFTPHHFHPPQW